MSNKNIFKNIVNSKNNSMSDKSKQKSILDYFGKKCPQIKRNCDHLNDDNKSDQNQDNQCLNECLVIENQMQTNQVVSLQDNDKTDPLNRDLINREFIDLSQYLQIDFSVEDKQIGVSSPEENQPKDDNQSTSSYVYHNFRQMIDFVLKDEYYCQLFDENDLNIIQSFTCLSGIHRFI